MYEMKWPAAGLTTLAGKGGSCLFVVVVVVVSKQHANHKAATAEPEGAQARAHSGHSGEGESAGSNGMCCCNFQAVLYIRFVP